ncbi:MAG: M48 family metallopeptidase [Bdellovibrionia bacterium]
MNEELAQQGVMNLAGLMILTAIPIAAFALWCDYFERFFQAKLDEREEVNRADELYRIRTAGFFINLVEILIFFGSTPIRREHPAIAYPLFLTAFLLQLALQRNLEGKVAGADLEKNGGSFYWQAIRTFFWSLLAGLTYVASILTSVFAFSLIGVLSQAPMGVKLGLVLIGMGVGVVGGLCISFALGALFVRKILNAQAAPEGELRQSLTELFTSAKAPMPEFWLIDTHETQSGGAPSGAQGSAQGSAQASAMMAGFPNGRGLFKPGFFISSGLVNKLTEGEFKSVVLHEISHWKLQHLKKRFTFSAGLILCAALMTGFSVLCSRFMGVSQQGQTMVGFSSLLISFVFAFRLLAKLVRYQEFAADIHAIEHLGATLSDLSSALRKLDRMSSPNLPQKRDPGSMLISLGHPVTEFRIRVLEKYFERTAELKAAGEQNDKAA